MDSFDAHSVNAHWLPSPANRSHSPAREGVIWPFRVDPQGRNGPTRSRAAGPRWRRTGRNLYVPASVPRTPEQRIVEAAAVLPKVGGVTGWGALHWWGAGWFTGTASDGNTPLDVQLACYHRRPMPGITICEEGLNPRDLAVLDGVRLTTPVRSVCFLMRYAPNLLDAVRAFDMAAYNDLVSLHEITTYAREHGTWTGIPQCREAIRHCDENAWSPREVDMRMLWTEEAGLPRPLTNRPVFSLSGQLIGTPDLIDPEAGVIGEYDGALHLASEQRTVDVRREGAFRAAGLEQVTMMAGDLGDHGHVIGRLRQAYARAGRQPTSDRAWTITPPPWWTPTHSVELRRTLSAEQRAHYLAIRRTA